MSESNVGAGEKTEWSGSISQLHYIGRWLLIVILLGALGASFAYPPAAQHPNVWIGRGVIGALVLILIFWIQLDRSQRRYTVTNRRIIVEYGIVNKRSNEIRLQDIRSINLTRSGIAGLLGVGRLEFSSAATDDAEVIFWNTPNAEKIRDMVRSLQA